MFKYFKFSEIQIFNKSPRFTDLDKFYKTKTNSATSELKIIAISIEMEPYIVPKWLKMNAQMKQTWKCKL